MQTNYKWERHVAKHRFINLYLTFAMLLSFTAFVNTVTPSRVFKLCIALFIGVLIGISYNYIIRWN